MNDRKLVKQALFIAGPTASGKSALSLHLADAINGVIINADSMQVYSDLPVLTACPSADDEARAPHRLYRFLDGSQVCSAAFWAEQAFSAIENSWQDGKTPILVGGTGMYYKVLLDGLAKVPEIPTEVREQVRSDCAELGSAYLHQQLLQLDPVLAARLEPADSQRVSRGVEVVRATGTPLSEWQKNTTPGPMAQYDAAGAVTKLVIDLDREALYTRCDLRFEQMFNQGALEEVEQLSARKLDPSLPVMRALGVPSILAYIAGEVSKEQAISDAQMQTRRFAKRQMTWFRNQFSHWNRVNAQYSESEIEIIVNKILKNGVD
jgi:tRNA dimethylallyltransferase